MCDLVCVWDMDGVMVAENEEGDFRPLGRPHLEDALRWTFENCAHVGVWTAAGPDWYNDVWRHVLQPIMIRIGRRGFSFVWYGDRCTKIQRNYLDDGFSASYEPTKIKIKCLKKLWRPKFMRNRFGVNRHNVLIIDNTPATYARNWGNAIPCPTFTKDDNDDDAHLLEIVESLKIIKTRYELQNIHTFRSVGLDDPKILNIIHSYTPIRSVRPITKLYNL
jgi:hypothetical protein